MRADVTRTFPCAMDCTFTGRDISFRRILTLAVGLFLCAAFCAEAQLTTTVWNPAANPSGNGLWSESANWTGGQVANSTNKVVLNVSGARACVVNSTVNAGQLVAGDNGPGGVLIVTNGGNLVASATDWSAVGYNNEIQMIVASGGSASFGNHLWIGFDPGSDGTLILNGGTVSVAGMFGLGWNGGKGTVQVNGGTLNLSQWSSSSPGSIVGASVLDIGAGTVVIGGNRVSSVSNFISSGKITGYGGTGMVSNFFNGVTTTLTAIPGVPPTTNVVSILAIKLVEPRLVISWPTSAVYYVLKSATNLAAPVIWKAVTNSVITSNGTNQVVLNLSGQTAFFRLASGVDASTMNRKLLMGYQGWFSTPGDGSAQNSWVHWFGGAPTAANANFDFWPDTSELDADELFSTSMSYSNGSPAKLYSAYKQRTVVRHFKWMQENNLDGVFFQRFLSDLNGANISALRNQVAVNVRVGAETYGRVFAIMYDISGYSTNTLVSKLTNDWLYLANTQQVTNSSAYLYHNGKPVVAIWGFGFNGRHDTPQHAQQAINWFKAAGCTVMGGLPTHWRTLTGDAQTNPAWSNVFRSFDVISPWSVGRYGNIPEVDNFRVNQIVPDLADCTSHGIDYLPVIFPGFSWANLQNNGLYNQIPRSGGTFYWRQAYNAVRSGCTMVYGAMFDEVDEGTAMYKLAPAAAQLPAQGTFVPLNADGYNLGSDWYLRLADQAGKMLRGEIPVISTIPITPP